MLDKIALAQVNPVVGDIAGNASRIRQAWAEGKAMGAALVMLPELALCGYPPEDLILRDDFIDACMQAAEALARETKDGGPALLVGAPWREGGVVYNAALLLEKGEVLVAHRKVELPNDGMFDEKRLFAAGERAEPVVFRGMKLGVMICEDMWHDRVPAQLAAGGAEALLCLNASPFEQGKPAWRRARAEMLAARHDVPLLYVNLTGGQDDIVFDGGSFVVTKQRQTLLIGAFEEGVVMASGAVQAALPEGEMLWRACCAGLGDYVRKNGFSRVVLGLSGGIDSAVVAAVAADALGKENVLGVLLPSPYSTQGSIDDALESARLLGIETRTVPIAAAMKVQEELLGPMLGGGWMEDPLVGGNLQARIRGQVLMAVSNKEGRLLLNTGNKSEVAVGYTTLYGDACGGYAPIKDVYKTDVYKLAAWRNGRGLAIPQASIMKPPSAELAHGQTDEAQLAMPYEALDALLKQHIEGNLGLEALVAAGADRAQAQRVVSLVRAAEYKRRQMPPGARVSGMMFSRDRRFPLTNGWKG